MEREWKLLVRSTDTCTCYVCKCDVKHTLGLLTPDPGRAGVKGGMRSQAGEPIRREISDSTTKACAGTLHSTSFTDLHLVSLARAHTHTMPEALASLLHQNHHKLNSCSYEG